MKQQKVLKISDGLAQTQFLTILKCLSSEGYFSEKTSETHHI